MLIEKKTYPFHRVCGEYISNETRPFLEKHGLFPGGFEPAIISQLQLTSVNGRAARVPLDLGGFGISRYNFDQYLYRIALDEGVRVLTDTEVLRVNFINDEFVVDTSAGVIHSRVVVGAHGKRSKLDSEWKRGFMTRRSPYVGVKYHIEFDHSRDVIALHNFKDGYCGISAVEGGLSNLCYLTHRNNIRKHGDVKSMEQNVLYRNPFLKDIFTNAKFLFEKPEVINEISFETKLPVENHVLMCGDAAGMITPLCGNGMALAIHASSIVSDAVGEYLAGRVDRSTLERNYEQKWNSLFSRRLWVGRQIQNLFGSETMSDFAVNLARYVRPVANFLVRSTHGAPF